MKYIFNEDFDKTIKQRILQLNNTDELSINVSNFAVDYNLEPINEFKNMLLSYKDKRFFIVGDYDCDGICATAIMKKLFDDLGIMNNYYIPSRIKEGYGLNNKIIETAYNNKFDCILCVDNGIVCFDQIELCNSLGLKCFIIDHHNFEILPNCESYLHPSLFELDYQDMCASGLCCLLSNSIRKDVLTMVLGGIATLADMVKIFGYNRFLVKEMLSILKSKRFEPINLLLGKNDITYKNIQFNVIPKINAVSRLDDLMNVNYLVKYLLANDNECLKYFDKIELINKARKDYSKIMFDKAETLIDFNKNILIVKDSSFKEGLCGLVANRLLDKYKKPVIVFAEVDGMLKGSGRSVSGADIYSYLKEASNLFDTYGGHELAIGLSIKIDNFDKLISFIDEHDFKYEESYKQAIVINVNEANKQLLNDINDMEPFGSEFEEPLFAFRKPLYKSRYVVSNRFPKFEINDNLDAIGFNSEFIEKDFEYMIGRLKNDDYNPNKLSFIIEDLV